MKKKLLYFLFIPFIVVYSKNCKSKSFPNVEMISVKWELVSNFIDAKDGFEAMFSISNNSGFVLSDSNWALFFNMAPRPIISSSVLQPATVHHINGDWYKLVPDKGFSLEVGKGIDIHYRGTEGVIKEADSPMGLYFVLYGDDGKEERVVEVTNYSVAPFVRPEQMSRGSRDEEPVPTSKFCYHDNEAMFLLPEDKIKRVIPSPVKITKKKGSITISNGLPIHYQKGLESEATLLAKRLSSITGQEFRVSEASAASKNKAILLKLGSVKAKGIDKEAYTVSVSSKGVIVTGNSAAGVFYGIQTFLALVPFDAWQNREASFSMDATMVTDAPRFEFRGLHVDVCRNFQTKETIKRIMDIMSFYKLNHFLFYTTEDEGWRIEIPGLPELTLVGGQREHTYGMDAPLLHPAYGSGPFAYEEGKNGSGYYTREDFIEILKYATERHIKVVPVLNFPGHARAAIKSMEARYERLMKEGKKEAANEYRLIDPDDKSQYLSAQSYKDNVVCVARESVYRFYEKVVDEMAKMYKEAGLEMTDMHTGGDEVPEGAWTKSPMIDRLLERESGKVDPNNLQTYFFRKLVNRLQDRGLRVHGWEEVVLTKRKDGGHELNTEFVEDGVVPYVWNNLFGNQDLGYKLANRGYKVVLCNVSNFYFDLAYNKDPKEPGLYWAGFVNTRDAWTFAPYECLKTTDYTSMGRKIDKAKEYANMERLKPEARKNIYGVEAQLWSETIKGGDMIEYYMLPKLLGFAESAWASERVWEKIDDEQSRIIEVNKGWNLFANSIAQRELPRLSCINGGYNYRLPPPGAIVEGGVLKANTEFPGLSIRYTVDGSEPTVASKVYDKPVNVQGEVKLKSFDISGKGSRTVTVK